MQRNTETPTFEELAAAFAEYQKWEDAHDFYLVAGVGIMAVPKGEPPKDELTSGPD